MYSMAPNVDSSAALTAGKELLRAYRAQKAQLARARPATPPRANGVQSDPEADFLLSVLSSSSNAQPQEDSKQWWLQQTDQSAEQYTACAAESADQLLDKLTQQIQSGVNATALLGRQIDSTLRYCRAMQQRSPTMNEVEALLSQLRSASELLDRRRAADSALEAAALRLTYYSSTATDATQQPVAQADSQRTVQRLEAENSRLKERLSLLQQHLQRTQSQQQLAATPAVVLTGTRDTQLHNGVMNFAKAAEYSSAGNGHSSANYAERLSAVAHNEQVSPQQQTATAAAALLLAPAVAATAPPAAAAVAVASHQRDDVRLQQAAADLQLISSAPAAAAAAAAAAIAAATDAHQQSITDDSRSAANNSAPTTQSGTQQQAAITSEPVLHVAQRAPPLNSDNTSSSSTSWGLWGAAKAVWGFAGGSSSRGAPNPQQLPLTPQQRRRSSQHSHAVLIM
jgi:hypothetical protein